MLGINANGFQDMRALGCSVHEVRSWAYERGFYLADIDISGARRGIELHAILSQSLRFPAYYGQNWDAFMDCVRDLEWIDSPGYVLLLRGLGSLSSASPELFAEFFGVLAQAQVFWSLNSVPFLLVVDDDQATLSALASFCAKENGKRV